MRSRRLLETRRRVIRVLEGLARELGASVYLFGSYARGDHMIDSDVDLIVVSDRFRGLDVPSRVVLVRLLLPGDMGFDNVAFTPEEFEVLRRRSPLIRDASKYWIKIGP